jgi:hypothetical protein
MRCADMHALRGHACRMRVSFESRYGIGTLAAEFSASIT